MALIPENPVVVKPFSAWFTQTSWFLIFYIRWKNCWQRILNWLWVQLYAISLFRSRLVISNFKICLKILSEWPLLSVGSCSRTAKILMYLLCLERVTSDCSSVGHKMLSLAAMFFTRRLNFLCFVVWYSCINNKLSISSILRCIYILILLVE